MQPLPEKLFLLASILEFHVPYFIVKIIKATRGDMEHAQIDMIIRVYAHILDKGREVNAQKFESAFYTNPDLSDIQPHTEPKRGFDLAALIEQLKQSPELDTVLAGLIANQLC